MAEKIGSLPWIEDGIGMGPEFIAARGVVLLAEAGYLASLLEQPWVVEGKNYAALESLWALQINKPEKLAKIMSHPTISDGISDQEAKIVATLTTAADPVGNFLDDHDLLDKLLDPSQVIVEERTITLPLAGETDISIIRTGPGADHTMDFLEQSVRSIEEFMGLPFPRRQAIYLFVEAPGGGIHNGTHVQIRSDEQTSNREWMLTLLAHESSHYYWMGGPPQWLTEGAAVFMQPVVKNTLQGPLEYPPCDLARNIAELETLVPDPTSFVYHDCVYGLGERLLRDLYYSMDDTTFRQAFRRLYLHTVFDDLDECRGAVATICHVREAFTTYAHEENAVAVEEVIARWYGDAPVDSNITYSVRGMVTGPGGQPPGGIGLQVKRGEEGTWVDVGPDGAFDVEVPPGSFILEVNASVSSEWHFVGWYDGSGGITTDRSQASWVIVDGGDVEGIEIMLPTDAEDLLCPSGYFRSSVSGSCIEA